MTDEKLKEFIYAIAEREKKITAQMEAKAKAQSLEKTIEVKEYLKVCGVKPFSSGMRVDSKDNIRLLTFYSFVRQIPDSETNGIFVYCGTYRNGYDGLVRTNASSPSAEYRKYWDIEQESPIYINLEDCEQFESTYTVLNASIDAVRKTFVETTLNEGQAKALKLIKDKYPRKK